jgi:zinc protease
LPSAPHSRRSRPRDAAGGAAALKVSVDTYTFPNGLTVILSQDATTPTVSVNVWYKVGSKNEAVGRTGFAHLFEHVMFTGSGSVHPAVAR